MDLSGTPEGWGAAGTDEEVWRSDPRWAQVSEVRVPGRRGAAPDGSEDGAGLGGVDHLVVVAAHPDDETLGVGGLMADLPPTVRLDVVVATDGEASHPRSRTHGPADLTRVRREEVREAVSVLAPHAELSLVGLPDGGLDQEVSRLAEVVVDVVIAHRGPRPAVSTMLLAPWRHDRHPDHEAAAAAAAAAAWRTDAGLMEYPIWLWHLGSGSDAPWTDMRRIGLSPRAVMRKREAMAQHRSQVLPLGDGPGDGALLSEGMLEHFRRDHETLVVAEPGETSPFEDLHEREDDPWRVRSSWYERRKRALTLAALPQERYARTVEVGCSIGQLAVDLAARSDLLLALDESASAVATARESLAGAGNVEVRQAQVPQEWVEGPADLVVLSEVGYFLSPGRLDRLADAVRATVGARGDVVACHWRHEIRGWPMRGDDVHGRLEAGLGLPVRCRVVEDDVVITVWSGSNDDRGGGKPG